MIKSDKRLDTQFSTASKTARNKYRTQMRRATRRVQRLESEISAKVREGARLVKSGELSPEDRYKPLFEYVAANRDHPAVAIWDDYQKEIAQALEARGADYYKIHGPHIREKSRHPTIYFAPGDFIRANEGCYQKVISPRHAEFIDKKRTVYTPDISIGVQMKEVGDIAGKITPAASPKKTIICPICHTEFPQIRSTRKYCNKPSCRKAASRAAKKES